MQLFKDEGNEIVLDAILRYFLATLISFHINFPIPLFLFILCFLFRQLPFVPPSVIESEISPLIPDLAKALFIQNFSVEKPARMSPAIKSFLDFLKHMDSKVQDGLAPLMLPYLIKVAQSDGSTIQEKIAALGKFLRHLIAVKLLTWCFVFFR